MCSQYGTISLHFHQQYAKSPLLSCLLQHLSYFLFDNRCPNVRAFSGGSKGKESAGRLLAWETEVKSLGPEDPLEKDMATCM